jgi:hypothetical protein
VQTAYADFLQALTGYSIYPGAARPRHRPELRRLGTVSIPSRTAGGAGGGFVAEGSPIRVGKHHHRGDDHDPEEDGRHRPVLQGTGEAQHAGDRGLVRQAILEDTRDPRSDPARRDRGEHARPAGLLNGVSAVATGYGGGDYQAVIEDFKALLAPFIAANAATTSPSS